jgi:hypothetical protein
MAVPYFFVTEGYKFLEAHVQAAMGKVYKKSGYNCAVG